MPEMTKYKPDGVTQIRVTRLTGWFVAVGGAGTITSQSGTSTSTSGGQQCGVTVSRNAAGDFRLTLHRGYKRLIRADAAISHPALGVAPTPVVAAFVAVAAAGYFTGATPVPATGGLGVTCLNTAGALAEAQAGLIISYDIEVSDI
jgi:hypothetical protein